MFDIRSRLRAHSFGITEFCPLGRCLDRVRHLVSFFKREKHLLCQLSVVGSCGWPQLVRMLRLYARERTVRNIRRLCTLGIRNDSRRSYKSRAKGQFCRLVRGRGNQSLAREQGGHDHHGCRNCHRRDTNAHVASFLSFFSLAGSEFKGSREKSLPLRTLGKR